ncbi:MAG: flavodoxin-dependent (E)-4-hydroxy-3-methylbut-2-enyl-diphosphate synthase, partial [Eubacterium sp.]
MGSKIQVKAGNVKIGGGAEISVQSMLNIPSTDIEGSVRQAKELEKAGCQIIRAAIPNKEAVRLIPALKEAVEVPIVADIHFDYKLA